MKQAHIVLLRSFDELPFNVGKKTFIDFLKGNINTTIEKNNLTDLNSYGCLYMLDVDNLYGLVQQMLDENFIRVKIVNGQFQVLERTPDGTKEMFEKKFSPQAKYQHSKQMMFDTDVVNDQDRKLFAQFDFFLKGYNEEQKKAIISDRNNILCVAGAGSGKTTVLTKRIQFLKQFKSVPEQSVLAITFTRKAKEEMQSRLQGLGINEVQVETFNSFSERLLRLYPEKVYDKEVQVAAFRDKIRIVRELMEEQSFDFEVLMDDYFNKRQLRERSKEDLFFIFVNDLFSILDFFKNQETDLHPFYEQEKGSTKRRIAKAMYDMVVELDKKLKRKGLRDFSDQILDTLQLFKNAPEVIPKYTHILIDEYQDLNSMQYDLVKALTPENVFAVGDPRQAIYGWRGSNINYIIDFPKEFKDCQVLSLSKNYRSRPEIVDLFNQVITSMNLEDLESSRPKSEQKNTFLIEQDSEELERIFVAEAIKASSTPRNEIFVLARTNKILGNFADFFDQQGITYALKSEEEYKDKEPSENEITLATVHSIKGMEAEEVYVVGANSLSFPNKVQDNFVLSLVKEGIEYDKLDEELRLFYVALSRAKDKLVISYTGTLSKFITDDMLSMLDVKKKNKTLFSYGTMVKKTLDSSNPGVLKNMLKDWRVQKSNESSLPSYMVLSNAAIEDIVRMKPRTKDDLLQISGLGPTKIAKYGNDILRIING